METAYGRRIAEQIEIQRNLSQGTATICSGRFGTVWKALHPSKAAEALAAATGCSVRTAAYQLSGEHEPSARSIAAVIVEITKRG